MKSRYLYIDHQSDKPSQMGQTWRTVYVDDKPNGEIYLWCPQCSRSICLEDYGIFHSGLVLPAVSCKGCGWKAEVQLGRWPKSKTLYWKP